MHRSADADRPDVNPVPRLRLSAARATLFWEALWPRLWPAVAVLGVFAALVLFDVLPALPPWVHLALLAAFGLGFLLALWFGLKGFTPPGPEAAERRLERDSGLQHRPLSALRDLQASGTSDPGSRALWHIHHERLRRAAHRWRLRLPAPGLAARDRVGARGLLALVIALGVVAAWDDWGGRLGRAFDPKLQAVAAAPPVLDLVVTPPNYTGIAPIFLRSAGGDAAREEARAPAEIAVPVDSTILARVSGGGDAPVLNLGAEQIAFSKVDDLNFELTATAAASSADRLTVVQGRTTLGDWPIRIVPDRAPSVAFAEPPEPTERRALRIQYAADDDYGIESLSATVALADDAPAALDRSPIELALSVPGRRPKEAKGAGYFDLTPHPWAGLPVVIHLTATDAAGQRGLSEPVEIVLPEREFTHPVARAIIEQRKTLILDPSRHREVAEVLEDLSLRPDRYYDDPVTFLALRTAGRRLAFARDPVPEVEPVQKLLWDTALRIEDGDLSLAERALRDAQQELAEALDRDASDEEIARLMDQLREALDRYLEALAQQMMERMAQGEMPQPVPVPPENMLSREQLQKMLDQMQQLSESGAREQARQMLSQLQEMLENLQTGMMAQQQHQQQQEMMQLLEQLQGLTQAQRQLLDQTFQDAQQGQQNSGPGDSPSNFPGEGAQVQEGLRRALGDLMRRMGEMTGDIPTPFGRAEQSMRRSELALREGQSGNAVPPQTDALDQLQQGLQGLVDQVMEQMAQQGPGMPNQPTRQTDRGRDPLGRPMPNTGGADANDVQIPEQADIQRARQILDELRRRLGERDRPALELDYFERLLRQF